MPDERKRPRGDPISEAPERFAYSPEDEFDQLAVMAQAPEQLACTPEDKYFELPESHLDDSGLPPRRLVMFCRRQFHELFSFLNSALCTSRVVPFKGANPYTLGTIMGLPGTGKSTTVLAFAWTLSRDIWDFTWIHFNGMKLNCLQVVGSEKHTLVCRDPARMLYKFLVRVGNNRQHVVFVDGCIADNHLHTTVTAICEDWLEEDFEKRRLLIISSMAHRGKISQDRDTVMNCLEFFLESWTKEQYLEAVKDDNFYNNDNLNLDATEGSSREDLVESKFYFAGGSCRSMFGWSTQKVIVSALQAIETVGDISDYVNNTKGLRADSAVQSLLSCYYSDERKTTAIVSRYVATELAVRCGPQLMDRLVQCLKVDMNPAMDGWLFEMRFFAKIRVKECINVFVNGKAFATLPQSRVRSLDTSNIGEVPDAPLWWKPKMWNQAGYDAVFVDKSKGTVLFVQLTIAAKHAFKIEEFYKLLNKLKDHMEIKVLEIYFVSPKGITPEISQVTGQGLLHAFPGWAQYTEKDAVKKVSVDFSFE